MSALRTLDLFSGIGGFSLGLERTGGFETVAFCEIEEFPRRVLAKHWPNVPCYNDVRTLTAARLAADGIGVDVICGGFPCQDISIANTNGLGLAGSKSGLWSEICRLAGELRPQFIIVENVTALLSRGLGRVLGDLAAIGYDAEWHCIPASAVGAPHERDRFWLVAHPDDGQRVGSVGEVCAGRDALGAGCEDVADAERIGRGQVVQSIIGRALAEGAAGSIEHAGLSRGRGWWEVEPDVGRVADGVSHRVDRLRGLGNAVVPQIPELIGHAILRSMVAA